MARDRPSPYGEGPFFFRSAGACPPRALNCADDGEGNPLACADGMRGPSRYDEGGLSAAAAPGGAPSYCIETGRSLLRGVMKPPQLPVLRGMRILRKLKLSRCSIGRFGDGFQPSQSRLFIRLNCDVHGAFRAFQKVLGLLAQVKGFGDFPHNLRLLLVGNSGENHFTKFNFVNGS